MKYLYKPAILMFIISTLLFSCKKSSTTPGLVTFMKLDANGKTISFNSCSTAEIIFFGQHQTTIVSQGGTGTFTIILTQAPQNLKAGQVYQAQTIKNVETDSYAQFNYVPDNSSDNKYGYSSSMYNPVGSVTLTEVTSTSIKGTFTAAVFADTYGSNLAYTITNGTFCTGSSAYSVSLY
jgi:hypothetical protein